MAPEIPHVSQSQSPARDHLMSAKQGGRKIKYVLICKVSGVISPRLASKILVDMPSHFIQLNVLEPQSY
jgi:hypothetical protein